MLKVKSCYTIESSDLEAYIKERWGKKCNIGRTYEMHNNSYITQNAYAINIDCTELQECYQEIDEWLNEDNQYVPDLEGLFLILASENVIPEGEYIITCWW